MARGHKTGGRQKGTPNKRKAQLDAKFAEAAGQAAASLAPSEIASMMPLPVMLLAMRLEVECGQLRSAASIAEKAAPYSTQRWLRERRREATRNSRSRSSGACRSKYSPASELPPIASSCVHSSTFRLFSGWGRIHHSPRAFRSCCVSCPKIA
jgi:hypothetical protein